MLSRDHAIAGWVRIAAALSFVVAVLGAAVSARQVATVKVAVKGIARADVTWKATPRVRSVGKSVLKDQAVTGHVNTWTASVIHG